jgi:hypothetical protein
LKQRLLTIEEKKIFQQGQDMFSISLRYDVFSNFIKLFALKSATTKVCLNKLVNHYFVKVIKPKVIFSGNASQFRSPSWRKQLQHHGADVCDLHPSDIRSRTEV